MYVHPAVEHLVRWFGEVSETRHWTAIVSMAGGSVIPSPVSYAEIGEWARLTGSDPTPWEVRMLRDMDNAWRAAHGNKAEAGGKHQGLGEYCRGENIEECRQLFGDALESICRTCPS